jgi:hypothetical protein
VIVLPFIEDALQYVQKIQDPCGMVQIFVTGSTHLIGGMLALMEGKGNGVFRNLLISFPK